MARQDDEDEENFDEDDKEAVAGKPKKKAKKSVKVKGQEVMLIPRATSIPEMFNIINDKLDIILSRISS